MEISLNGAAHEVRDGLRVAELVQSLGFAPELVAVEVNRVLVPRRLHGSTVLQAGDAVELVTLVGGG